MKTFDAMVSEKKSEIESQPATVALVIGIDIETAKSAWLNAVRSEYDRMQKVIVGQGKSWHAPLDFAVEFAALGEIVKSN